MRLAPALSRLVFYFRADGDITAEQLNNVTVDLNGLPTAGNFNVTDGSFSADAESVAQFRMRTSSSTDVTVARTTEAFVMPLGSTQGYVATITANLLPDALKKKTYSIDSSIGRLERGMQYIFDVTVSTDGYTIESSSSPIAGWEEGDKISGEGEEAQS
ncbi:fimbrillin family protein [Bacteroides gallinarum]|nr:fimbrillin family protein [Bacteroides gallinarum]